VITRAGARAPTRNSSSWIIPAFAAVLLIAPGAVATRGRTERVNLSPRLRAGQTITYHVSYHSDKQVKTESPVVSASPPDSARTDVHALLRLEILDLQPRGKGLAIHARTRFEILNSDSHFRTPNLAAPAPQLQGEHEEPKANSIEFTLLRDGRLEDVKGLDALLPEQQQAWQEWASRFALAAAFPASGARMAQKVKSEEPEKSPSPIAGLRWIRESTYVRDEPCGPVNMTVEGDLAASDAEPDSCAVILTTATLKQQSSPAKATPEDFKIRELRTAGTARGTNRIITYIALKTGLLVRATEEANQNMDVTVAKSDGSNRVRYNVTAKSHSEVLLVSGSPLTHP
jgi:hypothetical protein